LATGDLVRSKTQRRIKDKDDTKSSGGERRTVTLSVRVEGVEFKADTNVMRVSGSVEEAPEDIVANGSHHTFNVEPGSELTIIKGNWSRTELDMLSEAVRGTLRPKVLVVSLDEGEATVALVRESRVDYLEFNRNIGGKYEAKGREARKTEFYHELTQMILGVMVRENAVNVILSGPGFEKNNYLRFIKENDAELASKALVEDTGGTGRNGVQEVLKRDAVNRVLGEVNAVQDIRLVEEILTHIGKDTGLAVYGRKEVVDAAVAGAAEYLLVTDELFFGERGRLEPVMSAVRDSNGRVHIINHESEAGQKLRSLGGLAAKLRYNLA